MATTGVAIEPGGPPLLTTRSRAGQTIVAILIPVALGALCGWLVGVDKVAYEILAVLALAGGYFAGQEHRTPSAGALRGLCGGCLFGGATLAVHQLTGATAKASLPHPAILLVAISAGVGMTLATVGGRRRELGIEPRDVDLRRLGRPELISVGSALLLLASLFLPWFSTACSADRLPRGCNYNSMIHGLHGGFNAFRSYHSLQWILLLLGLVPLISARMLIARSRPRTWRPGEAAMIAGAAGLVLVFANGIAFGRPGGDSLQNVGIALEPAYFLALASCALMAAGGGMREAAYLRSRRPAPRAPRGDRTRSRDDATVRVGR